MGVYMMFKKLKITSLLCVSAVFFLLFGACDNPFSNNMGEKVSVYPPSIKVNEPKPSAYIKGKTLFTGEADAHRVLRRVEYKISDQEGVLIQNWTDSGIVPDAAEGLKKWSLLLDTVNFDNGSGLSDGMIKVQFRASDNNVPTETNELIYIIKNNPSEVSMSSPTTLRLDAVDTGSEPPQLKAGEGAIRGQITDRMGIKPGYPQIKIWPADLPGGEPADNDLNWGWASLFITGLDDPDRSDGADSLGYYNPGRRTWKTGATGIRQTYRVDQFVFRLNQFTIEPDSSEPNIRRIKYTLDGGNPTPLELKQYRFRIKTSDTYSTSDTLPREPVAPYPKGHPDEWKNEVEAVGFYPSLQTYYTIQLTSDVEDPRIDLDNSDIDPAELAANPSIYITGYDSQKIAVGPVTPSRSDFRLQVATSHSFGIAKATLEWDHNESPARRGDLTAELIASGGQGSPANPRIYTFTAASGLTGINLNSNSGLPETIFKSSPVPYTLRLTVYTDNDDYSAVQEFNITMDGEGPNVNVLSVKGASAEPGVDATAIAGLPGGKINDNPYTVNGNIQTSVDFSDDNGTLRRVKWIIEEDKANYLSETDTVLQKLRDYRNNPTPAGLAFFNDETSFPNSGWLDTTNPISGNFKLNTYKKNPLSDANDWEGKELWLYVIAQDNVNNLGFILQKILVDDSGDIPMLDKETFNLSEKNANGDAITDMGQLDVTISRDGAGQITRTGNWNPANRSRNNILESGQGIQLKFTDDDGISLADGNGGLTITITDLNVDPPISETLTVAQLRAMLEGRESGETGNSTEWTGELSQGTMAAALYGPGESLPDGMYKIDISYRDNNNVKVHIDGNNPGDVPSSIEIGPETYFFAVFNETETPQITITAPDENSLQTRDLVAIKGTVKSRLQVQKLYITYTPDIITPSSGSRTVEVALTADGRDSNGYYVYDWETPPVNFNPEALVSDDIYRLFKLEAYDRLANRHEVERTVQVDSTPPQISLDVFNYNRVGYVNGKVPFSIFASDENGLMEVNASGAPTPAGGFAGVKWWALPAAAPSPAANAAGWAVPFPAGNGTGGLWQTQPGANYKAVFDTRGWAEGQYKLCAAAMDKAGNYSAATLIDLFTVDQASDIPDFNADLELVPTNGTVAVNPLIAIKGVVSDDDGYNAEKLSDYVQIRFPAVYNDTTGAPLTWGDNWIKVPGSLDHNGNLSFTFNFNDHANIPNADSLFKDYLGFDSRKYYQLRFTDEPAAGPSDNPPGKNPDGVQQGAPGYIGAVSKIYPSDTTFYSFIYDITKPVITFDVADPKDDPPPVRPTFQAVADLRNALRGAILDANLESAYFTYGSRTESLAIDSNGRWSIPSANIGWLSAFNDASQGPQSITITATDAANNTERASWSFIKDTQGPSIILDINRAIKRDTIPAEEAFPDGSATGPTRGPAWPFDWPSGTAWETGWSGEWRNIIARWPAEYRFMSPEDIVKALTAENGREPSVISGQADAISIRGRFSDVFSPMWVPNQVTQFSYSFNTQQIQRLKPIETPKDGQRNDTADWEIPLDAAHYFNYEDGEHTLNIFVADKAGNESFIYGLRFIVDRNDPFFGDQQNKNAPEDFIVKGAGVNAALPQVNQRVFSAAGATGNTDEVYTLSGFISDNNLGEFTAEISSEGLNPYKLTAVALWDADTESFVSTDSDGVTQSRLSLDRVGYNSQWQWRWTLQVLEKDVHELRNQTDSTDGTRRFISVTATDKARRRAGPLSWYFYLDSKKPVIEFTNLETGANGVIFSAPGPNIVLRGTAGDDTRIRDIKFSIAKWDYQYHDWRWYNHTANTWSLPSQPVVADWASALTNYNASNAQSMVTWIIDQDKINQTGRYPQNLFNETNDLHKNEGQYKLDLCVTDWSLSSNSTLVGNPHNTSIVNDPNFEDKGAINGDSNEYNSTTGAGNASARKFFVDRAEPVITWPADTRMYIRSDASDRISFSLKVSDPNTVREVSASLKNINGQDYTNWISYNPPSDSWDVIRDVKVEPYMTDNGQPGGSQLPDGAYTLELTVTDGAGKTANINTTLNFVLDNEPPEFTSISPAGGEETVTGRLSIKGNTSENTNLISKVAYYAARAGTQYSDTPHGPPRHFSGEAADGWKFYVNQQGSTSHQILDGQKVLAELMPGTFTWELRIPNTRNFITGGGLDYVQHTTVSDSGESLKWKSAPLAANEDVYKLDVYFLAIDEAGNVADLNEQPVTYWIYPEGDRPIITTITNPDPNTIEVERLVNGRINVRGMANDNERVRRVWIRVLDSAGIPYGTGTLANKGLNIPQWDENTWDAVVSNGAQVLQTPRDITRGGDASPTAGWYMANGGGGSTSAWFAMINTEGELEAAGGGTNKIRIEVCAEDATWNDLLNNGGGDWDTAGGLISRPAAVTAFVVTGAPVFEDEQVKMGSSADTGSNWGGIINNNISKRAAYRITVKDDSGLQAIRYTPTRWNAALNGGSGGFESYGGIINLLDPALEYNTTTYVNDLAAMDAVTPSGPGIAVKAEPKTTVSGAGLLPNKTYLIWEPPASISGVYLIDADGVTRHFESNENKRYTSFTTPAGFITGGISGGEFIPQTVEPPVLPSTTSNSYFEWVVTVDVNTAILQGAGGSLSQASVLYPVYLAATEISKSTPLTASRIAWLPIDNLPPRAEYTLNRRPSGLRATIGGEAGDEGPVNGLARVVVWFSRKIEGPPNTFTDTPVSWHEKPVAGGLPAAVPTWVAGEQQNVILPNGALSTVILPSIPAGNIASGGDYAIVIDRNDPSGVSEHHGHKLPMGLAAGGRLGSVWYVEFNSFGLVSGPVTIHYVVYDMAGNARYYKEPLVILNDAPKISRIKLGTDIRGNNALQSPAGNQVQQTGSLTASNLLDTIRNQFSNDYDTDVSRGITDWISTGVSGMARHVDFNARNNLLAFRVETTGNPDPMKQRNFRFEYVTGATLLTNPGTQQTDLRNVKAGRVYVINDRGTANWGALGAAGDSFETGFAFLATVNGVDEYNQPRVTGNGSAWELQTAYNWIDTVDGARRGGIRANALDLPDAEFDAGVQPAQSAEFVYKQAAFGTAANNSIIDFAPVRDANYAVRDYPAGVSGNPSRTHSLLIVKVFDGPEEDVFADFALLSVRVNNNDVTIPSAQLYDLNPMTEGQERAQSQQQSLAPMGIGLNRTRGGLWNTDAAARNVVKPGHIEPRKTTTLTSAQMGGAATQAQGILAKPWANPAAFFDVDTVSGRVILRGYAEDDQRIARIDLQIGPAVDGNTITILETANPAAAANPGNPAQYIPPTTGLLKVASVQPANTVYYTDTVDLNRHRVEWAYIWDSETIPVNTVVGNITVRALVYNANSASAIPSSPDKASRARTQAANNADYNSITLHLRPYINGFLRNQNLFFHNTRSRQGWYAFSREENVLVSGFNLGSSASTNTTITIPSGGNATANAATAAQKPNYGLATSAPDTQYRYFTVNANSRPGTVTLTANTYQAVNTGAERPRFTALVSGMARDTSVTTGAMYYWIQPWNVQSSSGTEGSDLWDDFTGVHVWQSNDVVTGADHGSFPTKRGTTAQPWNIMNPAMSIDPRDGTLYASQNEPGAGTIQNTGTVFVSSNAMNSSSNNRMSKQVMSFVDPIRHSDVYYSPGDGSANANTGANYYAVSSIIGRSSTSQTWTVLGGIWIHGPGGGNPGLSNGDVITSNVAGTTTGTSSPTLYYGESTWYNACTQSGTLAAPPTTDQFSNPRIVTARVGTQEHIHVSYYDTKDYSIKYRYNLRGTPGTINTYNTDRRWISLDGKFDRDDRVVATGNLSGSNFTEENPPSRVVNYEGRRIAGTTNPRADLPDVGEYNAIAVTSGGFPVIAYYDKTNQKLKLAVSNNAIPTNQSNWKIWDSVIPTDNINHYATGEFVSIRINHSGNVIHMAALNSNRKNLVYIRGRINTDAANFNSGNVFTFETAQVVDSVGDVGRWCSISLDAAGNPWIAYQDEGYRGSMDGVRMAFRNPTHFIKGGTSYANQDTDVYGVSVSGWETMNVPARYRVQDARLGMENFPTMNYSATTGTKTWDAAVGYLSMDLYRIAYYVKQ